MVDGSLYKGRKMVKTNMKRLARFLSVLLVVAILVTNTNVVNASSPKNLVSTALGQLDREEGANGFSKYGQWYGVPYGDWCDMFVSWCAAQARISSKVLPRSASCTVSVNSGGG